MRPQQNTSLGNPWAVMTMGQYVAVRNGVPLGDSKSLRNMLYRSFGSGSFGEFWQFWNPIWGYGLGRFVYWPMQRVLPRPLAAVLTFAVSGAIHDLAASAVARDPVTLITPWFSVMGVGVVLARWLGMDLSERPWLVRASVNLVYIVGALLVTVASRNALGVS